MDKSLKRHRLPKFTQEGRNNENNPTTIVEIEKKISAPDGFTIEFY